MISKLCKISFISEESVQIKSSLKTYKWSWHKQIQKILEWMQWRNVIHCAKTKPTNTRYRGRRKLGERHRKDFEQWDAYWRYKKYTEHKRKITSKSTLKMVGVKTTIEIIWYRHTEISSEVPQKIKNRATTRSNCTICQNNLASYYRVTWSSVFISALFRISRIRNSLDVPQLMNIYLKCGTFTQYIQLVRKVKLWIL